MNSENSTISGDFEALKTRHRELRENFDESFSIRIHRALAGLNGQKKKSMMLTFIFYWISFNANYSIDRASSNRMSEGQQFGFFNLVTRLDKSNSLYAIVWERFAQEIQPSKQRIHLCKLLAYFAKGDADNWQKGFQETRDIVNQALVAKNTVVILQILLAVFIP